MEMKLMKFSTEHKILVSYLIYKSSMVSSGDSQAAFVGYMHSIVCNGYTCHCDKYRAYSYPISIVVSAAIFARLFGSFLLLLNAPKPKGFFQGLSMIEPASRDLTPAMVWCLLQSVLRLENPIFPFSTESGISPVWAAPPMDQPIAPEGLKHLHQWPEALVSIDSEVKEAETGPFINSIADPISIGSDGDNSVNDSQSCGTVPSLPEKQFANQKQEDKEPATTSISEITDDLIDLSDLLNFERKTTDDDLIDVSHLLKFESEIADDGIDSCDWSKLESLPIYFEDLHH